MAEPCGRRSVAGSRSCRPCSAGLLADDQADQILEVGLADPPLGDLDALVHDGDAVADPEQVLQPVGDQHDRRRRAPPAGGSARSTASTSATASAEVGSSMISTLRLEGGGARRWRSTGAGRRRAGPPARVRLGMWISSASSMRLASSSIRRWSSSRSRAAALRLAAEEQVAGDVDRVAQREVLVDHLDPAAPAPRPARRSATRSPSSSIVPASGT